MVAIGFDLVVRDAEAAHPKSVTLAMNALKALPWCPGCVRDTRAFKVEHWSDFTDFTKS